ncbi:MAG: glycosyltransferase, partial [Halobacteriales archaeon]|nr:glycosyltransferase [Halobacteriales archaeon]
HQRRLGLGEPRYFNSGVLLIDLVRWRKRDVRGRALAHAREAGDRLILHDQDALNMALQGDWLALPAHWNVWVILPGLKPDDDVVFHYMGGPKPWDADYDRPFQDKFFQYLDRTPLRGWRPWNPVGIGAGLARLRRRTPHFPSVIRVLRRRLLT